MSAAAATTPAATAATATRGGKVIVGGHTAEFQRQADVLANFFAKLLELLLGGEEVTGDLVFEQGVAGRFEFLDFGRAELKSGMLFLVQFLTTLVHALVLQTRGIVVEETLDGGLKCGDLGVGGKALAKRAGLDHHGGFFSKE